MFQVKKTSNGHWGVRPSLQGKFRSNLSGENDKINKTRNLRLLFYAKVFKFTLQYFENQKSMA